MLNFTGETIFLSLSLLKNPFLARQQLNKNLPTDIRKPFQFQEIISSRNNIILESLAGKKLATRNLIKSHSKTFPDDTSVFLLDPNLLSETNQTHREKALENLVKSNPSHSAFLIALVEDKIRHQNPTGAFKAMDKFFDCVKDKPHEKYNAKVIALQLSVGEKYGRLTQAKEDLQSAAEYWITQDNAPLEILCAAGNERLLSGEDDDLKVAKAYFSYILDRDPNYAQACAGIIAASPDQEADLLARYGDAIPDIAQYVKDVDVEASDQMDRPISSKRPANSTTQSPSKKRTKKPRLPKDLSKPLDKERWLPLRDRTSYQPKAKKGKRLNKSVLSSTKAEVESPVGSRSSSVAPAEKKATPSSSANKKKKKKGAKW